MVAAGGLELNLVERALTKGYILDAAAQAVVGLFSCALAVALPIRYAGLSGFAYFLLGVTKTWSGMYMGRQGRLARTAMEQERQRAMAE